MDPLVLVIPLSVCLGWPESCRSNAGAKQPDQESKADQAQDFVTWM